MRLREEAHNEAKRVLFRACTMRGIPVTSEMLCEMTLTILRGYYERAREQRRRDERDAR